MEGTRLIHRLLPASARILGFQESCTPASQLTMAAHPVSLAAMHALVYTCGMQSTRAHRAKRLTLSDRECL